MMNKLKSSQLKYLLIRIILSLFEELYKIIAFAFYFLIFKDSFSEQDLQTKANRLLKAQKGIKRVLKKNYSSLDSFNIAP